MDHARLSTRTATPTWMRPSARHPGLVVAAFTVVGVTLGFHYRAAKLRSNELAQKNSGMPNLYVTVDRSGGGV